MLLATVGILDIVIILVYLFLVAYLGYLGYRQTKTAADYMVAGRKTHPFIMALSYGATFISTSAIVGFGGVAAMFGMSLLWLTFLNIFVGIFIAFVFLGGPTRRMGHHLDAHTYPELLGRRFDSKFIQVFGGLVIFLFMPLYGAAVLIGGTEFLTTAFDMDYTVALLVFSVIVAAYVIAGGLKAVMYTDTFQGVIMFIGMTVLLIWAYSRLGGVGQAHSDLTAMASQVFAGHKAIGHQGWTAMPKFDWGSPGGSLWWIVVSTIVMGVGIGVLAQPQLNVRFMTVKSKRELNRAVAIGGVFILAMTGVAFTVGAVSNVYFNKYETVTGTLLRVSQDKVIAKKTRTEEKTIPCTLLHLDTRGDGQADTVLVAEGVGKAAAIMPKAAVSLDGQPLAVADLAGAVDKRVAVRPNATSFTRAVVWSKAAGAYMFNPDSIIPIFIGSMPHWFSVVFLLTMLAAAMSTLSSQFLTVGTAFGRDVCERLNIGKGRSIGITRIGIILGLVVAVLVGFYGRGGYFIARATAIFFGLCASTFLPTAVGGLFWKRMTKAGAIASMIVGFAITAFWLLFVKAAEAGDIGLVQLLTKSESAPAGRDSILSGSWPVVDSLFVALPISVLVAVVVSLVTQPPSKEHLAKCFPPRPE